MEEVVYGATYNTASLRNLLLGKRVPNPDLCVRSQKATLCNMKTRTLYMRPFKLLYFCSALACSLLWKCSLSY